MLAPPLAEWPADGDGLLAFPNPRCLVAAGVRLEVLLPGHIAEVTAVPDHLLPAVCLVLWESYFFQAARSINAWKRSSAFGELTRDHFLVPGSGLASRILWFLWHRHPPVHGWRLHAWPEVMPSPADVAALNELQELGLAEPELIAGMSVVDLNETSRRPRWMAAGSIRISAREYALNGPLPVLPRGNLFPLVCEGVRTAFAIGRSSEVADMDRALQVMRYDLRDRPSTPTTPPFAEPDWSSDDGQSVGSEMSQ